MTKHVFSALFLSPKKQRFADRSLTTMNSEIAVIMTYQRFNGQNGKSYEKIILKQVSVARKYNKAAHINSIFGGTTLISACVGRRQAIIWNNAGILSISLFGTNFSEILIEILTFSFEKMRLKMSSAKWRPFCLGLNVLKLVVGRVWQQQGDDYRKTSNIRRTLVGNKIVDHSDVVGASPVGAAPTTSSFST